MVYIKGDEVPIGNMIPEGYNFKHAPRIAKKGEVELGSYVTSIYN